MEEVLVIERERLTGMIRLSPVAAVILFLSIQPWGWQIGLPIALFGLGWLVYGLFSFSYYLQKEARKQIAREKLTLLSQKRHDWMNHVQVLMAFKTVRRTEQIQPYLQRLVHQAAAERQLGDVKYPLLALTLVQLPSQYPEWQWSILSDSSFHLSEIEEEQVVNLIRVITSQLNSIPPPEGEPEMKIILAMEGRQPLIHLVSDQSIWEEHLSEQMKQGKLGEELQKYGGEGKLIPGKGILVRLQRKNDWSRCWRVHRINKPPFFPI